MTRLLSLAAVVLCLAAGFGWFAIAAEQSHPRPPLERGGEKPVLATPLSKGGSLEAPRKPWTTSRVVGSPEPPPPFKAVVAFPQLKFKNPLAITRIPGGNRLVVAEQRGVLSSFENKPDATADLMFDLPKELKTIAKHPGAKGFEFVYGVVFHPKYETNREIFVCYTLKGKRGERTGKFDHDKNLPDGTRVSRFKTLPGVNPPKIDPDSEEILLTYLQGGHNGGDLHFGPDGCLYISTGDATDPNPPDVFRTGQDITDLLASILRIDVDKRDDGKTYAIPADNPFVGLKVGDKLARGEVWAYGLRNPWRISFDRKTGELWAGDVGWEQWEMVHRIERGSNHGWSVIEAKQPINSTWPVGPTPIRPPAIELDHSVAASITGGYVYRGTKLPGLVGKYVFGDWSSRRMWAASLEGDRLISINEIAAPTVRVVAFGEDHAGELYYLDYDTGTVHTLVENTATAIDTAAFPKTLSATGLFANVKDHAVADGVYKFAINAAQWQDGAVGERFLALPGTSSVIDNEQRKSIPGDVDWHQYKYHFPKNAVMVKTLTLPAVGKRIETQLLHFDGEDWHGYNYQWRVDQTDADLVPSEGAESRFILDDPRVLGGKREQTWTFHSRSQCQQCHNFWSEHALGFQTAQLNRDVGDANQLVKFTELGLMKRVDRGGKPKPAFDATSAAKEPRMANPHDEAAKLNDRARAYLHANCAHCHRNGGGGTVDFELTYNANLDRGKVYDVPVRGSFELPDARVIAKADPYRSILYYRMSKFGSGHMPHLGSEFVDDEGLNLIRDWLDAGSGHLRGLTPGTVESGLKTFGTAVVLARESADTNCPPARRLEILTAAAKLPPGPVRDLFEGYITAPGGERKLGPNPRPKTILALKGDPAKGRDLFTSAKMQCLNCHKLDGKGNEIGPVLETVVGKRTRENVLESLLEPSRRIEQQFQTYVLQTESGKSYTGLLVTKTDEAVVLKLADNTEAKVPTTDVQSLKPSPNSLMPSGLLADLTAQQAADLLEFVRTLKGP